MSTETERLRIGLIGANGRWGPSAHIPAIQHLPQTELYAVCTAHEDTARAAAEKHSVEMAYWDDTDMLANTQVEAVAVAVSITAPLFLLVLVFQKQIVSGLVQGAVKG